MDKRCITPMERGQLRRSEWALCVLLEVMVAINEMANPTSVASANLGLTVWIGKFCNFR